MTEWQLVRHQEVLLGYRYFTQWIRIFYFRTPSLIYLYPLIKNRVMNTKMPVRNNGAASMVLTAEELTEIEDTASKIKVLGARYPEHIEKMTGL